MELYDKVAYDNARQLTLSYSTSFGMSSRLFDKQIKPHIYAIYGLVRIADEVVDTYMGPDANDLLDALEQTTCTSIKTGYSTNPIVHAFALTAREYGIDEVLIKPFFQSMRTDLAPQTYTSEQYTEYIHGSAEVVGLMCLRVFTGGDTPLYDSLSVGAAALGAAYQKINFLRDLAADYKELGRLYFPSVTYETFDEKAKAAIIKDIESDFAVALPALEKLPNNSRRATALSYIYYSELLKKIEATPVDTLKTSRIRISNRRKLFLLTKSLVYGGQI